MYELIEAHTSKNFTPAALVPAVFGRARTLESITIHWWGLPEWGDTFGGVVNFLCTNTKPTSAHEVIEAGRVAVLVSHADAAWAAGNGTGNATSIHLECRPRASAGDYATVAERIRDIRAMHGDLPLVPHRDWQATQCPGVWDLARLDDLARSLGTITPQGTITPLEEDDMYTELDRERDNRQTQILEAMEADNLRAVTKYVKGDAEDTLYEIIQDTGALRGITLAEWQASGRGYRTVPQSVINALAKA